MGNSGATAESHSISFLATRMQATDEAIVLVILGMVCQHKINPSQLKSRDRKALTGNTAGLVWVRHQSHHTVHTSALQRTLPFATCCGLYFTATTLR
jgi:hypothetical protein